MRVDRGDLVAELKALRKGRGLGVPDILTRVGPALRTVFSLAELTDPAQVRACLVERLTELARQLPADFAEAVATAYGLTDDSRAGLYGDRVDLVAQRMNRDPRTATRRIDDGVQILADLALTDQDNSMPGGQEQPTPWRTTALRTWVALDRDVAEVHELRRIISSAEELRAIRLEVSVPVPRNRGDSIPINDPEILVLSGGTLRHRVNCSSSRVVFDLELAKPLQKGQEHEFFICYRFSGTKRMRPFYACTPSYPCESFDLHIRFGRDHPPTAVWKVSGLRMSEVDDIAAPREPVSPDSAGDVDVAFRGLTPNLSYGIAWDE
jgi:hypothetical protein